MGGRGGRFSDRPRVLVGCPGRGGSRTPGWRQGPASPSWAATPSRRALRPEVSWRRAFVPRVFGWRAASRRASSRRASSPPPSSQPPSSCDDQRSQVAMGPRPPKTQALTAPRRTGARRAPPPLQRAHRSVDLKLALFGERCQRLPGSLPRKGSHLSTGGGARARGWRRPVPWAATRSRASPPKSWCSGSLRSAASAAGGPTVGSARGGQGGGQSGDQDKAAHVHSSEVRGQ